MPQNTRNKQCPAVCSCRGAEDVRILLTKARKDGYGRSYSAILNRCAREQLTPLYDGKRVRNAQEKIGVTTEGQQ